MIGSHSIRYLNHDPSQQWRSGINVSSNLNQNLAESGSLIVSAPRWKTYDFFLADFPQQSSHGSSHPRTARARAPIVPGHFSLNIAFNKRTSRWCNNGDPCRIWSRGCRVEADSKHHLRLSGTDTVHIYKFKYRCTY